MIESLGNTTQLGQGSLSSLLVGRPNITVEDKEDWILSDYVLHLEGKCYASKYLLLVTFAFLIVVEADKKIKFHRVLALEYLTRLKRYSNTEYVVKSYFMITMCIIGLLVGYLRNIYTHFYPNNYTVSYENILSTLEKKTSQVPATVRIISIVVWQSFLPILLLLCVKPFQTFCKKKIKSKLNNLINRFRIRQENNAEREVEVTLHR